MAATPFDLFAGTYREQQRKGATLRLNPLVAGYGPALLDRAILDALGKATGNSFAEMIAQNMPGIAATELTPDIDKFEFAAFLSGLKAAPTIELRARAVREQEEPPQIEATLGAVLET